MVKIILEYADNGIIKTVCDDNSNGAGNISEQKNVYEFDSLENSRFSKIISFFFDMADDLGIDIGNGHEKQVLFMGTDWGNSYLPTTDDINDKITELKAKIKYLETLKTDSK